MSRSTQQGRGQKVPQDLVSAEVIYEDGEEIYRNVKINKRRVARPTENPTWVPRSTIRASEA